MSEKKIEVTTTRPGHAHTRFEGTYEGPVTETDIAEKFAHSHFGGRMERFGFGRFVYCRHDD